MAKQKRNKQLSKPRVGGAISTSEQTNAFDSFGRYHRENGQYGTNLESEAYIRGDRHGSARLLSKLANLLPRIVSQLFVGGTESHEELRNFKSSKRLVVNEISTNKS